MTKTPSEQREYQRGYNRANSRHLSGTREILKIARAYRDRLKDMDTARQCHTCQRWERGGPKCVWGYCAGNFNRPSEPAMWSDMLVGDTEQRSIITTEDFGCVNWLPR